MISINVILTRFYVKYNEFSNFESLVREFSFSALQICQLKYLNVYRGESNSSYYSRLAHWQAIDYVIRR